MLTLAAWAAAEGALFHSGWYNKYIEPDSSAGQVEYHLFWLRRTPAPKVPDVLVVGDSRIAEGFSSLTAQSAIGNKLHFTNFGMPGSYPRVWYYTIRDADPQRNRFAAIVLALGQYSDQDREAPPQRVISDLSYLAGRLRLSDCGEFARSYEDYEAGRQALTGCILRGVVLRPDILSFLGNIRKRLAHAKDWRNNGDGYIAGYGGKPEDVIGLSADWTARTVHYPPGLDETRTGSIKYTVMPEPSPQTGDETRYRTQWLGGIVDLYKNSATRIVFMELPRAPLPVPEAATPPRFIDAVSRRPQVAVLPEGTFRDLERPDVFADGMHLNHVGRPIFSQRLAERVSAILP